MPEFSLTWVGPEFASRHLFVPRLNGRPLRSRTQETTGAFGCACEPVSVKWIPPAWRLHFLRMSILNIWLANVLPQLFAILAFPAGREYVS
jgi:hypothetical protein